MSDEITDVLDTANEELEEATEEPMPVEEYIEQLMKDGAIGRSSHEYLLDAIEHYGTREVVERGEEKERYRFFDDPTNNGEHAVYGNTDMLNEFVKQLRVIVNSENRMQKMMLFNGPTATGKSELKRCLISGLRAYSKTEDGKRYTCEWNISALENTNTSRMSYGDNNESEVDPSRWYESPVQQPPISIVPNQTRHLIQDNTDVDLPASMGIDPFSKEVYNIVKDHYEQEDGNNLFEKIIDPKHVRVKRYVMDKTKGIGVLTAEDDGSVKERIVGSWMPSMFQKLESRGRKNPQAFSYDGVIAQGNGGVTVVEDATTHADILIKMLNIPDEEHVKIDKQIGFDVDTVPIFISNPDLVARQLKQVEGSSISMDQIHEADQMKALKRRLHQYQFKYLTNITDEYYLLLHELAGITPDWDETDSLPPTDPLYVDDAEFAPRTIQAVSIYSVVTRLEEPDAISIQMEGEETEYELSTVEKALFYDQGYIEIDGQRIEFDDVSIDQDKDGSYGIPITHTKDVLSGMTQDQDIILPGETIEKITKDLESAPLFNSSEIEWFTALTDEVLDYIYTQQKQDVINAILADRKASEETVKQYIQKLYNWYENEEEEPDPIELKVFETKYLGIKEEEYNEQNRPSSKIVDMRVDDIIKPLQNHIWSEKEEDFTLESIEYTETDIIQNLVENYRWEDVFTEFENLNPVNWNDPPENTETEQVKRACIENMHEMFDYSLGDAETRGSAKIVSEKVFERLVEMRTNNY